MENRIRSVKETSFPSLIEYDFPCSKVLQRFYLVHNNSNEIYNVLHSRIRGFYC